MDGSTTMDNSTFTHVAAILVGVLLTLVIALSFQKKPNDAVKEEASTEGAVTASKKKKKKKKAKGTATTPLEPQIAGKETEPAKSENATPKAAAAAAPVPTSAPAEEAPAKKKRIRKKKGAAATSNGANQPSKENQPKQANVPVGHDSSQPVFFQQKPQEEEWIVETSKKKRNRNKKPAVAAGGSANPASPATSSESVVIDAKKVGIIIGPKGATMMAIQEATGVKLDINAPSKDDKPSKNTKATVVLSGSPTDIPKAKRAIQELADKGYATILKGEGFAEQAIQVHPRVLSEIVGPGGTVIKRLQETLEVNITIPPTDWKPNSKLEAKMVHLGIAGARPNCKQAKQVIQSIVRYHHHEITHPGLMHEEVDIPSEFYHCVIGPRGSEIRHIRGNFKCDVHMPNGDSYSPNIIVVGKQSMVEKTIAHMNKLIDRDAEKREQRFDDDMY